MYDDELPPFDDDGWTLREVLKIFIALASMVTFIAFVILAAMVAANASDRQFQAVDTRAPARIISAPMTLDACNLSVASNGGYALCMEVCKVEDQADCVWDATRLGNRQGRSFYSLEGVYYYLN